MNRAERVSRADAQAVAAVLARAFFDDPVFQWLLPDAGARKGRLPRFFRAMVGVALSGRGEVWSTRDRAGAAVWLAPSKWRLGALDMARVAPAMLSVFGGAIGRLLALQGEMEHAHLTEPHHYLFILGTDPSRQGQGVGTTLMAPVLRRCDADRLPAYLESSNPRNLGFYRRHGFAELDELHVRGSPPMTRMRRPSRQP